jgi:nucleoside-diphosphate-sugar epimerase
MKRAVIIGGKGKVGTYLVPMLVEDGFEVINVKRSSILVW